MSLWLVDVKVNILPNAIYLINDLYACLVTLISVFYPQVQELQTKITTETKRADKSDFEIKRLQDKMSSTQKEKDR